MILLCYDGSADAKAAIDRAGPLMSGSKATVLVIWETILETMTRHGALGMGFGMERTRLVPAHRPHQTPRLPDP